MMRCKYLDSKINCTALREVYWWQQVLDKKKMMANSRSRVSHNRFYCKPQPEQGQGPALADTRQQARLHPCIERQSPPVPPTHERVDPPCTKQQS